MILKLFADVAAPKSSWSTIATERPRRAASQAAHTPWIPAPTTRRSKVEAPSRLRSRRIRKRGRSRQAGAAGGPYGPAATRVLETITPIRAPDTCVDGERGGAR